MRTRPRNLKYKAKLKARKEIEEARILLAVRKATTTTQKI
jgi:AmiR/NasT family two-component response regulator